MLPNRDKRLKMICSLVMLTAIALVPSAGMIDLQAQDSQTLQLTAANPDIVNSLEERPEPLYGYIRPPMDLSHLDGIPVAGLLRSGALPDSFDWRDQGKVTSIRNQLPCGTCWIFGTVSVLESAVLIAENTTYDFSEQSVALCVDRSWVYLYDQADEPCGISHGGGWSWLAAEVLIKKGAVLESCNSYNSSRLQCNGSCLCDNCTPVKTVNGYRYVTNDQSQTDLIKQAVYDRGPVTMAYYDDGNHRYTDPTYGTVYDCAACPIVNHLVSIIGWDDSVPHFETPGTGAWLVKNSWGTDFGNSGYLWLAYNSSCMEEIAYLEYKDYDPHEKLYYWDEAGFVDDHGYEDPSAWIANIFTSTQDGNLTHVDFWTTSNNAQYDIYVYLDGDILDGLDNLAALQFGTCQELGYYSIPLAAPVPLPNGQPFTIVVNMTTPGYDAPIPVEEVRKGFVEPTIQAGVSYTRSGDTSAWEDLAAGGWNACLRARVTSEATEQPDIVVAPPSFEATVPPDAIWNATLTIDNVGDASLTYYISDRETTLEGSTAGVESSSLNPHSALSPGAQVVLGPTVDVQKALSNGALAESLESEPTVGSLESVSFRSKDAYWADKTPRPVITAGLPEDCPWLAENPESGSTPAGETTAVTVTIDTTGLTVGNTYTADIVIGNNDPDENPTTVPVTLHISGVVVRIDATTVGSGQVVTLPINITGVTNLGLATIWLSYDKNVVTVDSVANGDMGAVTHAIFNADGVTKTTWYNAYGKNGTLVFAQVALRAATTLVDLTSALDLDVKEFVDTSFNNIGPTVTDGTFHIDVTAPTCTIGVGTNPIYDGDLIQEVTVTYSEAMSATPHPTINFDTTAGTWSSNGNGVWSVGQTVWTESFAITDAHEEVTGVDVSASGAKDAVGDTQTAYNKVDAFNVDTKNPTVAGASPVNEAENVAANAPVSATFSEAIVAGTNIGTVSITPNPGGVSASVASPNLNIAHNDFTGFAYTVNIPAGAVKDAAGNPNGAYSWSFSGKLMEGDANLNNCVSGADALLVARFVVGLATLSADQSTCADTTDDGYVTGADALHVAQWIVDPAGGGGVLKRPLWESPADDDMGQPQP